MKSLAFGKNKFAHARHGGAAFTMVELLTVIAIIAILAAIIFPVFAQMRENSRRSNTISNMQRIYSALRQYKLDNRTYPEYLFGPVLDKNGNIVTDASVSPDNVLSMNEIGQILRAPVPSGPNATTAQIAISQNVKAAYKESLFPAYINDVSVFSCPDNVDVRTADDRSFAVVQRYKPGAADGQPSVSRNNPMVTLQNRAFYKYDAFDASPAVTGPNTIDKNNFQLRYSRLWMINPNSNELYVGDDLGTLQASNPNAYAVYSRQLLFNNPSADAYVTMTTYHVPNTKICVLYLNGTAKVLDARKLDLVPGNSAVEKSANAFWLTPGS